jgi:hypothetical protein
MDAPKGIDAEAPEEAKTVVKGKAAEVVDDTKDEAPATAPAPKKTTRKRAASKKKVAEKKTKEVEDWSVLEEGDEIKVKFSEEYLEEGDDPNRLYNAKVVKAGDEVIVAFSDEDMLEDGEPVEAELEEGYTVFVEE